MSKKKSLLVVCPGRGSYGAEELGYLTKWHSERKDFVEKMDRLREERGEVTVSELDNAEKFSVKTHTPGHNASILIHTCAYLDYLSIDREAYDIDAITGNSMGWYLSLACANALSEEGAFAVVNTMGSMMKEGIIGGQIIYPIINDDWQMDQEKIALVKTVCGEINDTGNGVVYPSINLGGYAVLAGDESGIRALMKRLPKVDERYPFRLAGHAAFHTPLLREVSEKGQSSLSESLFKKPSVPMIDGRGHIWQPAATNISSLWDYTLGSQVYDCYDFSSSIKVSVREFAPDKIVLLGPGGTLGGAIAQCLIDLRWQGIRDRATFSARQSEDPILISMGRAEQRTLVTGG